MEKIRGALAGAAFVGVAAAISLSADAGSAPVDALARLKAGNARFVLDASEPLPVTSQRRTTLVQGQSPYAMVLSCADSRVPPEVIFHVGLGDLFVIRSAGHVPDRSVLASLEYGAEQLRVPLLVVMGHEMCGVVKAAVDSTPGSTAGPNLDYLLKAIRPAALRTANQPAESRLRVAILENVEETINTIIDSSSVLRRLTETNRLMMVGAYYELSTGRALFSQPVGIPPTRTTQPAPRSAPRASDTARVAPSTATVSGAPRAAPSGPPAAVPGAPAPSATGSARPVAPSVTRSTAPAATPASPAAASQPAKSH